MDSLKILTKSDKETKKLGEKLAREIAISYKPCLAGRRAYAIRRKAYGLRQALVISLEGDLGAGKTTFTQGFAKGLGVKETPKSPTFVIMRIYAICHMPYALRRKAYGLRQQFIHIDAYRVAPKDLKSLGWNELIKNPKNIILVEWGNKIKNILPKNSLVISFGHIGHLKKRLIKIYK